MPRSTHIFKKRKGPVGMHRPREQTLQQPPCDPKQSTSSKKLEGSFSSYDDQVNEHFKYDIADLNVFNGLLSEIAVCKYCQSTLKLSASKRVGLAFSLDIICGNPVCDKKVSRCNSDVVTLENNRNFFDINVRFVYALRSIGVGQETGQMFTGVMNLPRASKFLFYNKLLYSATQDVCQESMKDALELTVQQNDGNRDISAAFDGSWQKRGYSSLNGVVTATSITTGQVIDVEVLSKFCQCKGKLQNNHEEDCKANFIGTSGAMEVEGVEKIFKRSEELYDVRYKYYLGDGDSKSYSNICVKKPYGEDFDIVKLECVGHVQKRMGTRLRSYKKANSKKVLSDGKKLGGIGRLTEAAINTIQLYYGLAIRRNASKGVQAMKEAIWAEYFHLGSTNENPNHGLCPAESTTWCKFRKAEMEGKTYDHEAHTHLPLAVLEEIKPIFRDLANPTLLTKCTHGGTQNVCESVNNVIWSRIPKKVFVKLETLKMGVYEAIASYNKGCVTKCLVLEKLGLKPGYNCLDTMKLLDKRRINRADKAVLEIEKKCRQKSSLARKQMEDVYEEQQGAAGPSYAPGNF